MAQKSTYISIRDALEGDQEVARKVTLSSYEEYAKSIPPFFWEGYRKNIIESLDEKGPAQHIVAEYAGKIVGSVLLYPPEASAYGAATDESTASTRDAAAGSNSGDARTWDWNRADT